MRQSRFMVAIVLVAGIVVGLLLSARQPNSITASAPNYDTMPPLINAPTANVPTQGPAPSYPSVNKSAALYSNDFTQKSAGFEVVELDGSHPGGDASNWNVRDGLVKQEGIGLANSGEVMRSTFLVGANSWSNYTIHAKAYAEYGMMMGVVFNYQNLNNYYRVSLTNASSDNTQLSLEKVVDGKVTVVAAVDKVGFTEHTWTVIEATTNNGSIKVSINGKQLINANDTSFTSGKAGLLAYSIGGMSYDDLLVTAN